MDTFFYYILPVALLGLAFCEGLLLNDSTNSLQKDSKSKKFFFVSYAVICSFLFVMAAFRTYTGRDFEAYYDFFYDYNSARTLYNNAFEFLYKKLNLIFYFIFKNYYIFQFAVAAFCMSFTFIHYKKNTVLPFLTLFLYFSISAYFKLDLGFMRQSLAMAVLYIGYNFVKQRKIVLWLLFVVIASLFHKTSVIALPLYFTHIYKGKWNIQIIVITFVVSIFIYLFGFDFIQTITKSLINISALPAYLRAKMESYIIIREQTKPVLNSGFGFLAEFACFAYILFLYIIKSKKAKDNVYNSTILNFLIFIVLNSVSHNFTNIYRLGYYFLIVGCGINLFSIFTENESYEVIFEKIKISRGKKIIQYAIFALFLLYQLVLYYKSFVFVPYHSILFR